MLFESLNYKDMEGLLKPEIHIDEFVSKMGDDDDILVISFFVRDPSAAKDLVKWFESGYDFIIDADRSAGEIKPNRYLVYIELRRRSMASTSIHRILEDLSTLTEFEPEDWTMTYEGNSLPYSQEEFERIVPLSPKEYRKQHEGDLNEWRVAAGLPTKAIYKENATTRALKTAAGIDNMRASEFLNEVGILRLDGTGVKEPETVTITIPKELLHVGADDGHEESAEQDEDVSVASDDGATQPEEHDELADIVRLSKTGANAPKQGANHTIAAPATADVPEQPVFISPLQQQLELQKQQGGKENPIINQIIDHDKVLGSTAGEQPEQSVYHDSPLEANEYVGAETGAVDHPRNSTTTQGATKPWYKL